MEYASRLTIFRCFLDEEFLSVERVLVEVRVFEREVYAVGVSFLESYDAVFVVVVFAAELDRLFRD